MSTVGQRYARGKKAYGVCRRCGLRALLNDLVFDQQIPWLRVHQECFDPKHPQEKLVKVTDPIAVWRPSPEAQYTYPVLSGLQVTTQINLTWTKAKYWDGRVDKYDLYRGIPPVDPLVQTTFTLLKSQAVVYSRFGAATTTPLTWSDTPIVPGTTYQYRVSAVDVYGRLLTSNIITVTAV